MVEINDVTLRDGQQSLLGGRMQQHHIAQLAPAIAATGFGMVEVWGGTCYEIPVRFKGEDPWENLDALRAQMPRTKLSMLLRGQSLVSRGIQGDETVALFVATAAKHGINNFRIFDALNDIENLKPALAAVKKAKEEGKNVEAQGTLCYTPPVTLPGGEQIHTTAQMVEFACALKDAGADTLCIKDMAGLLNPQAASELVRALKTALPEMKLTLHTHATMGQSNESLKAAIEAGVDAVDTASENLANGGGQSATEEIYAWLKTTHPNKTPKLNEAMMVKTGDKLRSIRPCYARFENPYRPELEEQLRAAQVPGGMLSTMQANIRDMLGEKNKDKQGAVFSQALEEMVQVRADAGYPPLVTPTSQIVMTQAVMNAVAFIFSPEGATEWRYKSLTPDFAKLVQGHYGRLPAPVSAQVRAKAAAMGVAELPAGTRPADEVSVDLAAKRAELQAMLKLPSPSDVKDEDLLTSVMLPDVGPAFLKHHNGIAPLMTYDEKVKPLAIPHPPVLLRHEWTGAQANVKRPLYLPRADIIPPIAIPYIDRMLHDTVEKLRHESGFITHATEDARTEAIAVLDGRIATEKKAMLNELVHVGEFTHPSQALVLEKALPARMAQRAEALGVPFHAQPPLEGEEVRASLKQAADSMQRAR